MVSFKEIHRTLIKKAATKGINIVPHPYHQTMDPNILSSDIDTQSISCPSLTKCTVCHCPTVAVSQYGWLFKAELTPHLRDTHLLKLFQ